MHLAGKRAKELGHVILLDPVGAGASALRTNTALELIDELHPTIVRGNASEIKALALGSSSTQGVDANAADVVTEANLNEQVEFVAAYARSLQCIVAITGPIDLISNGTHTYAVANGRPEMEKITGTGCQISGIATAFAVANPDATLEAVTAAIALMGVAGDIAWDALQPGEGNASYRNRIIDAIYTLDAQHLDERAKLRVFESV